MSVNLDRILRDLASRRAAEDSRLLPTPSTRREASASERNAVYTPPNFGILFCPHSKSYFDVCPNCHRTRKDAKRQYEHFCLKNGIEA